MADDPKAYERMLDDAENRLDRLRALYEQWFQGVERLEPTIPRKNFDRFMEQLRRNRPRVTGLKFRYQNLVSRYTTYVMYWRKVARQIEEGTYRRDVLKARKVRAEARERFKKELEQKKAEREIGAAVDSMDAGAGAASKPDSGQPQADEARTAAAKTATSSPAASTKPAGATPPAPSGPAAPAGAAAPASSAKPAPATPAPAAVKTGSPRPPPIPAAGQRPSGAAAGGAGSSTPAGPSGSTSSPRPAAPSGPAAARPAAGALSDQQMRGIYDRYVNAKTRNNESENVNYEKLAGKVAAMMPELQKKHAGKQIDFEVVVRNGKVALKPVIKS